MSKKQYPSREAYYKANPPKVGYPQDVCCEVNIGRVLRELKEELGCYVGEIRHRDGSYDDMMLAEDLETVLDEWIRRFK